MFIPLFPLFLLLCFAGAFYKGAETEKSDRPILWAGLSAGMFLLTWYVLRWGILGDIFGQFLLIALITAWRVIQNKPIE